MEIIAESIPERIPFEGILGIGTVARSQNRENPRWIHHVRVRGVAISESKNGFGGGIVSGVARIGEDTYTRNVAGSWMKTECKAGRGGRGLWWS